MSTENNTTLLDLMLTFRYSTSEELLLLPFGDQGLLDPLAYPCHRHTPDPISRGRDCCYRPWWKGNKLSGMSQPLVRGPGLS